MNSRERSVGHLANFYTVVVGLALSATIFNVVNADGKLVPFSWPTFILGFALIITLLPFYHGAMRHLDITYIEKKGESVKRGTLLGDFIILFFEGCLFIALAVLLKKPLLFVWGYMLLLAIDVAWGIWVSRPLSLKENKSAEVKWTKINLVTFIILFAVLFYYDLLPFSKGNKIVDELILSIGMFFLSLIRTVVDYRWAWDFYYPTEKMSR